MPRGDRTGPWGWGPRSGRGLGFCGGFGRPGFMVPGPGRGFGRGGRGCGFFLTGLPGWARWFWGWARGGRGRGRGWGFGRFFPWW
ncbi:MAG: hypothetical protein DSZ24_05335 [Thermodesulfatator sp.]|nr:MAG: hypothetical protein DSZ24_05335 [Thermodesulfatator sp.]